MNRWRSTATRYGVAFVLVACSGNAALYAQTRTNTTDVDPLGRALMAEEKGEMKVAVDAYREVLQRALVPNAIDGDRIAMALLGLERIWTETGVRDSILPLISRVLMVRRTDPVARSIQLRQLTSMGRDVEARAAFLDWRRAAPNDAAPFREYSQLLITANRARSADSILAEAARFIGNSAISGELAQLHVALQRWQPAAVAFRQALDQQPWLETSALFALSRAPVAARDSIREVLRAEPVVLAPRRLLSILELSWNEPRRAWLALSAVRADDSTAAAWRAFGERAEMAESWVVARDVWLAVLERRGDLEAQQRAGEAAINAGDAAGALEIVRRAPRVNVKADVQARERALLPVEIRALGELGRVAEAEQLIASKGSALDAVARRTLARPMVNAWLKAGSLDKARKAAESADLSDDDEISGWLALYDGDLSTAKRRLVRTESRNATLNDALGLLARTRVTNSPSLGRAFMHLAQRDSAAAAASLAQLADSLGDAAPALLALAARIEAGRDTSKARAKAVALWERVTTVYPKSPEAPEALLAWARVLREAGDKDAATQRLEALLLGYPDSALLPQARRELERLRGQVPPAASVHDATSISS